MPASDCAQCGAWESRPRSGEPRDSRPALRLADRWPARDLAGVYGASSGRAMGRDEFQAFGDRAQQPWLPR